MFQTASAVPVANDLNYVSGGCKPPDTPKNLVILKSNKIERKLG